MSIPVIPSAEDLGLPPVDNHLTIHGLYWSRPAQSLVLVMQPRKFVNPGEQRIFVRDMDVVHVVAAVPNAESQGYSVGYHVADYAPTDGTPSSSICQAFLRSPVSLHNPMRINITGNAGAGKSTVAARVGAELGVAVYSLDSVVWRPNWVKTPADERLAAEQRLVELPDWIIDGVSPLVRARADLVLFLDVPRHVCAWRGIRRALRYGFGTRPDLPHPCPEIAIVPRLLKLIHRFPSNAGAQIRLEANQDPDRFRIQQHPVDIDATIQLVRDLAKRPSVALRGDL